MTKRRSRRIGPALTSARGERDDQADSDVKPNSCRSLRIPESKHRATDRVGPSNEVTNDDLSWLATHSREVEEDQASHAAENPEHLSVITNGKIRFGT
jgi:hypothetical protein